VPARESWILSRVRSCRECGAAIPWGAPQCVACGSYTLWRDRLATFGIAVGAGTVLVVLASLAWVWLAPPPEAVRAAGEVQELLRRIDASDLHGLVAGAGRCKPEVADALCVQTTAAFDAASEERRAAARAEITAVWRTISTTGSPEVVFVDAAGNVAPPAVSP
jgi:hypothetical protein